MLEIIVLLLFLILVLLAGILIHLRSQEFAVLEYAVLTRVGVEHHKFHSGSELNARTASLLGLTHTNDRNGTSFFDAKYSDPVARRNFTIFSDSKLAELAFLRADATNSASSLPSVVTYSLWAVRAKTLHAAQMKVVAGEGSLILSTSAKSRHDLYREARLALD